MQNLNMEGYLLNQVLSNSQISHVPSFELVFPESTKTGLEHLGGIEDVESYCDQFDFIKKRRVSVDKNIPLSPTKSSPEESSTMYKWPESISELLGHISLSQQKEICQLESLLKTNTKTLASLVLPKSKGNFTCIKKEKRNISLPKFLWVGGVRYAFSTLEEVLVGGFSFVGFYVKKPVKTKRKFSIDPEIRYLPEKVALKVTRVDYDDFDKLYHTGFCTTGTTVGWLREFLVQTRLKTTLSQRLPVDGLPFADLYAAALIRLTPTTKRLQVFSVIEAGVADFHSYFMHCPVGIDVCHTFDISRRLSLLHLMHSAADNLELLHRAGLHHGDVKLSNILIDNTMQRAMFTDFDGSVFLSENMVCDTYTREYISPQRKQDDENFDAFKDDSWALGICLLKILTRKANPLKHLSFEEVMKFNIEEYIRLELSRSVLPYTLQAQLKEVISKLLCFSESYRITAGEAAFMLKNCLA